jgi:hypothetical protein
MASEDLKRRTYRAALSLVTAETPRNGNFVIFREYPVPMVAEQMRLEHSSARSYMRELGPETYSTGTDEQGRFWRLRLPEEDEAQQLLFFDPEIAGDDEHGSDEAAFIAEVNILFRQVAGRVHDLEAENEQLRSQNAELGQANDSLTKQNGLLKGQIEQVMRVISRIDLDILRKLIKNEQETREND